MSAAAGPGGKGLNSANDPIADISGLVISEAISLEHADEPSLKTSSLPFAGSLALSRCCSWNEVV